MFGTLTIFIFHLIPHSHPTNCSRTHLALLASRDKLQVSFFGGKGESREDGFFWDDAETTHTLS